MQYPQRILSCFSALILIFEQGCGWQHKGAFWSPHHIRVLKLSADAFISSAATQIQLLDRNEIIYTSHVGPDLFINFVQVSWTPDDSVVALFINGSRKYEFAFNFQTRTRIAFNLMRSQIEKEIREEYHLSESEDPFNCRRCMDHFVNTHPEMISR